MRSKCLDRLTDSFVSGIRKASYFINPTKKHKDNLREYFLKRSTYLSNLSRGNVDDLEVEYSEAIAFGKEHHPLQFVDNVDFYFTGKQMRKIYLETKRAVADKNEGIYLFTTNAVIDGNFADVVVEDVKDRNELVKKLGRIKNDASYADKDMKVLKYVKKKISDGKDHMIGHTHERMNPISKLGPSLGDIIGFPFDAIGFGFVAILDTCYTYSKYYNGHESFSLVPYRQDSYSLFSMPGHERDPRTFRFIVDGEVHDNFFLMPEEEFLQKF